MRYDGIIPRRHAAPAIRFRNPRSGICESSFAIRDPKSAIRNPQSAIRNKKRAAVCSTAALIDAPFGSGAT
jgi:hypothetical protein